MIRLLTISVILTLATGAPHAMAQEGSRSSMSVVISFKNLGTTKETTADLDGVPLTYPVDEADVITLLRPALTEFREARKQRARVEANALREAMSDLDVRKMTLKHVQGLLGMDSLSDDIDKAYDKALKEIDILTANWEGWSGDLGSVHLYNHATVAPFRKGENRIEFEQVHFLVEGSDDGFLADWIKTIRETTWNRTNAGTVFAAYQQLKGKDLKTLLETP